MQRFLLAVLFVLCSSFSFAQSSTTHTEDKQWFIQLDVFSSLDHALKFQADVQNQIAEKYSRERSFSHFASLDNDKSNYRLLLGPYPTQKDAQETQVEIDELFTQSQLIALKKQVYVNYQQGYQLTWHEIDKKTYQTLQENSLVRLDLANLSTPSLAEKRSLIAHTDQITEEIFDLERAKTLLQSKNIILIQDDESSNTINGYQLNDERILMGWPSLFYAYYPTEELVVLMAEGESLTSLAVNLGKTTPKMPFLTLYEPNRQWRITGSDLSPMSYDKFYVEHYDRQEQGYRELMDLGVISPWNIDTAIDGLAWLADNEFIFQLQAPPLTEQGSGSETHYYRVSIEPIAVVK